ncbi:hypothetical protein Q31b_34180 [Novipirellula aureliae]|uniref:Uncharacterized protein n=1 Tax=Novipirellula aureliae TaxID=2527966 RepID=A0A5C6DUX7_9BACT|nr:hypothetical protein [Novipirellula aureliae]TWU40074.1 hypothetical protein Q31b_34180 [Novipirellula aureliae]
MKNGPQGGLDKLCHITISMPGVGTITTTGRSEKAMAAVAQAARRSRHIVINKMKRPMLHRKQILKSSYAFEVA